MSEGGEAVPGAVEASTEAAPAEGVETQAQELATGERPDGVDTAESAETYTVQGPDGQDIQISKEELVKGYMRQGKFTKSQQELAQERKQFETNQKQTEALIQRLRQPQGLIEFLHEAGFPIAESLDAFNKQVAEEAQLDPREQSERQLRRQQERYEAKLQREQQRIQQMEHQQAVDAWKPSIQTWTTESLKAVDLPLDREHIEMISREMEPLFQQAARPVTADDFRQAAERVDKRLSGYAKRRGLTKAPTKQPPPSPQPGPGARPQQTNKPAPKKSMSDWRAKLKDMRGY